MASDGRHFLLDRASLRFERVGEGHFRSVFSGPAPQPAETIQETGVGSVDLLRASSGLVLRTRNAYCSEGEQVHHWLREGDRIIDDHIHPCYSVSAIETAGDQLWLGTRLDAESSSPSARADPIRMFPYPPSWPGGRGEQMRRVEACRRRAGGA